MGKTSYPDFDVLAERDAWDPYTRELVLARLKKPGPLQSLRDDEAPVLRAVIAHLLNEHREDLLNFVVSHIDRRLKSGIGEAQRKPNVPPEAILVRRGLAFLDAASRTRSGQAFAAADSETQFQVVAALQLGHVAAPPEYAAFPQKALFKKLQGLAVDAYASHPIVWSEMGYAGPAYPRGYYRIERGLRDPWEATRHRHRRRDENGREQGDTP